MNTHSKNQIENIQFLSLNQLSVEEEDHFADALDLFSKRVWCAPQIADIPDTEKQYRPSNAIPFSCSHPL